MASDLAIQNRANHKSPINSIHPETTSDFKSGSFFNFSEKVILNLWLNAYPLRADSKEGTVKLAHETIQARGRDTVDV